MKTLLWKEAREAAFIALPAIVIASVLWFATGDFEYLWLAPRKDPLVGVLLIGGGAGMLLAWLQFRGERWLSTQALLVHRGTGHRGAFLAKALVGSSCAWAIAFVPLLLVALVHACGENGAILQWARLGEFAIAASDACAAYAITAWAVNLRRGGSRELFLVVATAPSALLSMGALLASASTSIAVLASLWIASNAFGTLLFGSLALRAFEEPCDADLPLSRRHWIAATLLAPWLYLNIAAGLVGKTQGALTRWIAEDRPSVWAESSSGLLVPARKLEGRWYALDARGEIDEAAALDGNAEHWRRTSPGIPADVTPGFAMLVDSDEVEARRPSSNAPTVAPWRRWTLLGLDYERFQASGDTGSWARWVYLDRPSGVVRLFGLRVAPHFGREKSSELAQSPPFERVFAKPNGARFERALLLGTGKAGSCIADVADGTLWRIEVAGDSVRVTPLEPPRGLDVGALARVEERGGLLFVGDVRYEFDGEKLAAKPAHFAGVVLTNDSRDVLAPKVRVTQRATGATLLERSFEPHTARQRISAVLTQAIVPLRPPLVVLRSFFGSEVSAEDLEGGAWDREALVAGGARPTLFALSMLVALACTAFVVRRQRLLGHGRVVLALSTAITALFGPWALLWLLQLEPRALPRARASKDVEREPELLIQTV